MSQQEAEFINVTNCARCGRNHDGLVVYRFERPVVENDGTVLDSWSHCPATDDPILVGHLAEGEVFVKQQQVERQELIDELFKVRLELEMINRKVIETWPLDDEEEAEIHESVLSEITAKFGPPTQP